MTFAGPFLAVDWGTTNRRVYLIEEGTVRRTERDDRGVTSVTDFESTVAAMRTDFGDLPMLLAGMVGANIGWRHIPYVSAPANIADLASGLSWIDERTAIVPGVRTANDVMRGEEVQLLGAVKTGLAAPRAVLVQPGTHSKWVWMEGGRIERFTTAMTGELFGLLRRHSLLAPLLDGQIECGVAYLEGVNAGINGDLAATLFSIRAGNILGTSETGNSAAFASGLLIGNEVAHRMTEIGDLPVIVLAGPELGRLYCSAITAQGGTATMIDSQSAFVAGIVAIRDELT
ncbi:2-dehydro-3-deoxygalactonokinase [Qipengyuania sp.]|uniref:2-dehydro-3-deoxygalactonokinase n=1 Tax=Qipengyuania sp. TaxID=2004515 RepID=UPI0035C85436